MKEVVFVSKNKNKAKEIVEILKHGGIQVIHKEAELDEIQDPDVACVAKHKALLAYTIFKMPVLVEDTGLYIATMHGYPGSLIKHFLAAIGQQGIIDFLKNKERAARAVTAFAFCEGPDKVHISKGETAGEISIAIKGQSGFGWDPIFVPEGHEKTYAQMSMEEKNAISHRKKALEKFCEWIKG